jgi:signal transduction histidine kinase
VTESNFPVPPLRDRLGGRWAISWQAFAISTPLAVLSVLVTKGVATDPAAGNSSAENTWGRLIVALISISILGGWTYVLHLSVFRDRRLRVVDARLVVAFAVISGIVFGVCVAFGLARFEIDTDQSVVERVIFTTLVAAWWGLTLQLLLEARWRFLKNRDELIEQAVQMEIARSQEVELIASMRSAIEVEVDQELAEARKSLNARLASTESDMQQTQWTQVAQSLRETAEGTVRPLSKRLWTELGDQYPRPSFGAVLVNIVRSQPFRPVVVSFVYLISSAPAELRAMGNVAGMVVVALAVLTIMLIMGLANALMTLLPRWHTLIFLATVFIIEVTSLLLVPVRDSLAGRESDVGANVAAVLFSVVIIFATSGFGAIRERNKQLLHTFQTDIDDDRIEVIARSRQISEFAREASRVLHGAVQTKLLSCAASIDQASAAGDVEQFNRSLLQARAVLETPIRVTVEAGELNLSDNVERKCSLWSGLCSFTIEIDPSLRSLSGLIAINVGRIVEEGVANAVRHGNADEILVSVTMVGDQAIRVQITDNGNGPDPGPSGLGTELMQQVSQGSVRLVAREDQQGSTLVVDVPCG